MYDIDMYACHTRFCMLFINKTEGSYLHSSAQNADMQRILAENIKVKNPMLNKIPTKVVRTAIKIKALAMLNGGGIKNPQLIRPIMESNKDINNE